MTDDYDEFTKRMTSFDLVLGEEDPMAHSDLTSEEFLAHYGIKGMKWGVRRKVGPDGTVLTSAERKAARKEERELKKEAKRVERQENFKRPVTEDAQVSSASRARSEKHGTDALSNKELQALVTRMNLEQQYTNLQASGKAKTARQAGQEYVGDILKDVGRELASEALKWAAQEAVKTAFNQAKSSGSRGPSQRSSSRVAPLALEVGRRALSR